MEGPGRKNDLNKIKTKLEKPPILFHASLNNAIEIFEPRSEKVRDEKEGPKVFATPSKAIASMFMIPVDDSWVQSGECDGTPYILISDEQRFKDLDTGGTIYSLPSGTFENDPTKGLRELEWTSSAAVKPISKEIVSSALQEMLKNGVAVRFITPEKFQEIQSAPDGGESVVKALIYDKKE